MATVYDIADYLITLCSSKDQSDVITHLKLQKLIYYSQGLSLNVLERPLFNNHIEAWTHGPVCPDIYQAYKKSKDNIITPNFSLDEISSKFTHVELNVLNAIDIYFCGFSASKLCELSHQDKACRHIYNLNLLYPKIPLNLIKESCKTRILKLSNLTIDIEFEDGLYIVSIPNTPVAFGESKIKETAIKEALETSFVYITYLIETGQFTSDCLHKSNELIN
ncbi:MAG: DUF4065 domain-containing protein [Deltaproteobacteria bacterium]|jgi:uncharacterized phage-associated protein|nr:DUF4065 domain-containing protein [Deltaproteobacteria bacterium]